MDVQGDTRTVRQRYIDDELQAPRTTPARVDASLRSLRLRRPKRLAGGPSWGGAEVSLREWFALRYARNHEWSEDLERMLWQDIVSALQHADETTCVAVKLQAWGTPGRVRVGRGSVCVIASS